MARAERYQITLIAAGIAVTLLLGVFFYRELFPEYRIYQNDYIALEEFRSNYTGEPPPPFQTGVKQIVQEREDKGPAEIDRCISCHVALQLPHFSPTQVAHDANGQVVRTADGTPVLQPNENYIWLKLDQKVAELTDTAVNAQLKQQGEADKVASRLKEAEALTALKTANVNDHIYDVTKVLSMHPLIGKETRPFEFHPLEEYGCVVCHNGNGKGLTTEKAHGPVFDGTYEVEYMGPKLEFLEKDPANDPRFARVFNDKPGHQLLFQTSPIFVGSLIQAKCVQCHEPGLFDIQGLSTAHDASNAPTEGGAKGVDKLTENYQRGQQLFISQACYACHRIARLARGGVGPELTREGDVYPWFVKESVVWPQADLKTSTMPNYQLDHRELEDLMTFLMGQKGPTKATSATGYKIAVQEWEAGKKLPWEKPVTPTQMHDLRYAMTVFATQGCAACHRLKGFESNVGYAIQKGNAAPSFDALYEESQWFQRLFPENAKGSALVEAIDKYGDELDKRIIDDVRQGSILEELSARFPDTIEALYENFRFAARAKNDAYAQLAAQEADPARKQAILDRLAAWQQRVHRVLMVYIQEYGLGRLIGPRPNWSGIYRSDEWLMEHFRNPAGHVPRSIMPIMPFDDSKFASLTYMLDVLGKRDCDAVRTIWQHRGFSPEQAYAIHCSQCHGDYLQGNGPVATWIYPIPKNLRNAEFLRNLTKEEAIRSITHGVKGTPMAPWGETPKDKPDYDGIPVMTQAEIAKLVDWLYASLPGATVIKGVQDVPKWHYAPSDVIDELQREGASLKSGAFHEKQESGSLPPKHPSAIGAADSSLPAELLALFPTGDTYYASLQPQVSVAAAPSKQTEIDKLFDTAPNPNPGADKYAYYIKKDYYTKDNIERGKQFFEMNCASCHGKEADGSGMRASIMFDAKPRMLTNLDWINTHDDLRLLRSIKYGVPGTAMTPWGDQTSALQRLQLVIFIRSLSEEKDRSDALSAALYQAFEPTHAHIESARRTTYPIVERLEADSKKISAKLASADIQENAGEASLVKEALQLYEQQLKLAAAEKAWQAVDSQLLELSSLVKEEQNLFQALGNDLIALNPPGDAWPNFLKAVALSEDAFVFSDQKLQMPADTDKQQQRLAILENLAAALAADGEAAARELAALKRPGASGAQGNDLLALQSKADQYRKVSNKVLASLPQLKRLHQQEQTLMKAYLEKLSSLGNAHAA